MAEYQNLTRYSDDGALVGQDVSDKVGFWGTTPVVQQSGANQARVTSTASITCTIGGWGYDTSTQATGIVTLLNEIRGVLVTVGIMKGSA